MWLCRAAEAKIRLVLVIIAGLCLAYVCVHILDQLLYSLTQLC